MLAANGAEPCHGNRHATDATTPFTKSEPLFTEGEAPCMKCELGCGAFTYFVAPVSVQTDQLYTPAVALADPDNDLLSGSLFPPLRPPNL